MSTLVDRVVFMAQARHDYEEAWRNYQVDGSPLNRVRLDAARRRWARSLAVKELDD